MYFYLGYYLLACFVLDKNSTIGPDEEFLEDYIIPACGLFGHLASERL